MKSMKDTMIGIGALAFAALCIVSTIWVLASMGRSHIKPGLWWNEYNAQMDNYLVCIDESQHVGEDTPFRMVHLRSITNDLTGITGHDYDMKGTWDRIFFNGYPSATNGCNSYVRVKGGWRWEPCDWDKSMKPIPQSEIPKAIALLNSALTNRTIGNLTTLWTYHSTTDLHRLE